VVSERVSGIDFWHKSLSQPLDTGDAKKPRVGPHVNGSRFIEQGEAFGSALQQPFMELFTASTEEAIDYLI
jgi:hypothetical protein